MTDSWKFQIKISGAFEIDTKSFKATMVFIKPLSIASTMTLLDLEFSAHKRLLIWLHLQAMHITDLHLISIVLMILPKYKFVRSYLQL